MKTFINLIMIISAIAVTICEQGQCCDDNVFKSRLDNITSEEAYRVKSTLCSFDFLYKNAQKLSELTSQEKLECRLDYLYNNENFLKVPDCPETEGDVQPGVVSFQKINRYLFDTVDYDIYQSFSHEYPEYKFAFPVIEWAENIFPEFIDLSLRTFEMSKDEVYNLAKSELKRCNLQPSLTSYFKQGYIAYKDRLKLIMQEHLIDKQEKAFNDLFSRLKCSMCYPARVSCVML